LFPRTGIMSAAAPTEAEVEELNKRIRELESVNVRLVERLRLERGTSERVILNMLGEGGGSSAANSPRSSLGETLGADAEIPEDVQSDWKALSVIVLGATGDLAKKKTFPALLALSTAGLLQTKTRIVGYGRSQWSQEQFVEMLEKALRPCPEKADFIARCTYQSGKYDSVEDMEQLTVLLKTTEANACPSSPEFGVCANRLYYFAIPPFAYAGAARAIHHGGLSRTGWNRMVVEKPFGRDSDSYLQLQQALAAEFSESQIYRIDHYLGKEIAQSLMTLRFSNLVFEPLWNRSHVACVRISFKEDIGTMGRGGYFDEYGIVRDVMQNHLLQLLALVAMEPPITSSAEDVRNRKVEVLRSITPLKLSDLVIGQYQANPALGQVGYLDDRTVPEGSITPTYAMAVMYVNNARWAGVPFVLVAGKALDEKLVDIRVQFKPISGGLYDGKKLDRNELVMRVQPDEAILLRCMTKSPGLSNEPVGVELDLTYKNKFQAQAEKGLPDAYERLILDALNGDSSLFVRDDELAAAWRIFTPALCALEEEKVQPEGYTFGSAGPDKAAEMLERVGYSDEANQQHKPGYRKMDSVVGHEGRE